MVISIKKIKKLQRYLQSVLKTKIATKNYYWIAYTCHYHNDKFDKAMEECLESIDEYVVLLNNPRFCKKVYYYLNPTILHD